MLRKTKPYKSKAPKISVIIPIYNVEKYVKKCLDSVKNQTLTDIEIICVDDCGNDDSMRIVKKFAKEDNRFRIIRHDVNKGQGPARNTGIFSANGEYIFFLDSDDYILHDTLERLYSNIEECHSDFSVIGMQAFSTDHSIKTIKRAEKIGRLLNKRKWENFSTADCIIDVIDNFNCVAWGKLFRKEFIDKNKLLFINQNVKHHEDNGFWMKVVSCFPKVSSVDSVGIMYRISDNSVTAHEDIYEKQTAIKTVLEDVFEYLDNRYDSETSDKFKNIIKNSNQYAFCHEFRNRYLRFRWLKNNKEITICGLQILKESPSKNGKHTRLKLLGIPVCTKFII